MFSNLSRTLLLGVASSTFACGGKAIDEGTCGEGEQALFATCIDAGCSPSMSKSAEGLDSCEGSGSALTSSGAGSCVFEGAGDCYVLCDCSGSTGPSDTADPITDADADGVPAEDDCNDTDSSVGAIAQDADCDGVTTAEDCDDTDAEMGSVTQDGDCDGVTTSDDCDDSDASLPNDPSDWDCDGHTTATDCDDNDPDSHPGATDDPSDDIDQNCNGVPAQLMVFESDLVDPWGNTGLSLPTDRDSYFEVWVEDCPRAHDVSVRFEFEHCDPSADGAHLELMGYGSDFYDPDYVWTWYNDWDGSTMPVNLTVPVSWHHDGDTGDGLWTLIYRDDYHTNCEYGGQTNWVRHFSMDMVCD